MNGQIRAMLRLVVGGGVYVNASRATAYTVVPTIGAGAPHMIQMTPTGSSLDFTLPPPSSTMVGVPYLLTNTATSGGYSWVVKGQTLTYSGTLSSASTIGTTAPGESVLMVCYDDGTYYRWSYTVLGATIATSLGTLTEGLSFAPGITKLLDVSTVATNQAIVKLADNLAVALDIREATNSYLKFVTTNGSESVAVSQRMTTTDGVASGTARVVGGNAYTATAAVTLTSSAAETSLGTYTIPANTVKAGTTVRVQGYVRVTGNAAADTLTLRVKFGTSTVLQTTALTMIANDIAKVDCLITGRAAPSGTSQCAFGGFASWTVSGTAAVLPAVNAPANQATSGALDVKLTGQWSASSASDIAICEEFTVDVV